MKIHSFSWNLFAKDKKTINNQNLNALTIMIEPETDIILFSLQEVNDNDYIKKTLK